MHSGPACPGRELCQFHLHDILLHIRAVPWPYIFAAVVLTALNDGVLTLYDIPGFGCIGRSIGRARIAITPPIACAFGNTIGFMSVSDSAERYRLYSALKHGKPL